MPDDSDPGAGDAVRAEIEDLRRRLAAPEAALGDTETLRQRLELYRAIARAVPNGVVFVVDPELRYVIAEGPLAAEIGIDFARVVGRTPDQVIPRNAKLRGNVERCFRLALGGEETSFESSLSGRTLWTQYAPVRDRAGDIIAALSLTLDVTRQRRTEAELSAERALLRTLFDAAPDTIHTKDREGRYVLSNRAQLRLLGLSDESEAAGRMPFDLFPAQLAAGMHADDLRVLEQGETVYNREERVRYATGEEAWHLTIKAPLRDEDGEVVGLVAISRNIQDRIAAAQAERESNERLRLVMRHARCIINFGEVVGREGWREGALEPDQKVFEWSGVQVLNPEAAQEVLALEVEPNSSYQFAWSASRRTADHHAANLNAGRAFLAGEAGYENDLRCTDRHGVEHWLHQSVTVRPLTEGRWQVFGIAVDVTEQKRVEAQVRLLNTGLEQRVAERTAELLAANEEMEGFAYAVSHDLRAPLRAMGGFSQALMEDHAAELPDEARVYLDQIAAGSRRMGELIDGLLVLSRISRGELRRDVVDLSAVAERIAGELSGAEPERRVAWEVEPGLTCRGDARLLEAALHNLLGNAWKYTRGTAAPRVRVHSEPTATGRAYCVADNGAGFDPRHADKLFLPFQRLHRQEEFPGLGIGLATVQRIIHRHGGTIAAEGAVGRGATLRFTLPGEPATEET